MLRIRRRYILLFSLSEMRNLKDGNRHIITATSSSSDVQSNPSVRLPPFCSSVRRVSKAMQTRDKQKTGVRAIFCLTDMFRPHKVGSGRIMTATGLASNQAVGLSRFHECETHLSGL